MNGKEPDEECSSPAFPGGLRRAVGAVRSSMPVCRVTNSPSAWAFDHDRVAEWFEGAELTGGEVWHVVRFAWSIPGGFEIIVPGANEGTE